MLLRAEMVQRLIGDRRVLAVAGSHGKTTTTALLAQMTVQGGLDPLVLLGGDSPDLGGNAREGAGEYAVVEADEYAEAFLEYEPAIALIGNVEPDHLDYYGSEQRLRGAFEAFAERVQDDGSLIVGADSPAAAAIGAARRAAGRAASSASGLVETRNGARPSSAPTTRVGLDATVLLEGRRAGQVLAARARPPQRRERARRAGGGDARGRRLQARGRRRPRGSRARAAASSCSARRAASRSSTTTRTTRPRSGRHWRRHGSATPAAASLAAFSRTPTRARKYLLERFRDCFEGLAALFLVPTYAARETPSQGLDAAALAREIENPEARYVASFEAAARAIEEELLEGDVFLTLGAGDVDRIQPLLRALLEGAP